MTTATSAWGYWPGLNHWNFTLNRLVGLIDFGAANFHEMIEAVSNISGGNEEEWVNEWSKLANSVEKMAIEAEKVNNQLSARNAYFRACNYYRMSQFFLSGDDERKVPLLEKMDRIFRSGLKYVDNVDIVSVPYENTELEGYFIRSKKDGPCPTMIYINGADSLPPEVYFTAGKHMAEVGINFLVFYAPGVGLSLYKKKISTRPDSEAFVTPALEFLLNKSGVDKNKIILIGESFAGYLVPRAAAYESRIAAAVVWSPVYKFDADFLYQHSGPSFQAHLIRLLGASDYEDMVEKSRAYDLDGVVDKITCPIFLIQGSEDFIISYPIESAIRIYAQVKSVHKKVRVIERDEGLAGVLHCQKDNLHVAHFETLNWLHEIDMI